MADGVMTVYTRATTYEAVFPLLNWTTLPGAPSPRTPTCLPPCHSPWHSPASFSLPPAASCLPFVPRACGCRAARPRVQARRRCSPRRRTTRPPNTSAAPSAPAPSIADSWVASPRAPWAAVWAAACSRKQHILGNGRSVFPIGVTGRLPHCHIRFPVAGRGTVYSHRPSRVVDPGGKKSKQTKQS